MERRWRVAVGAIVMASLALSACSGGDKNEGMQFDGQKVANGDKLLSKVENRWRKDLQGHQVNKPDAARCYFAESSRSEEIQKYSYCGPVRYKQDTSGVPEDDVWVDLEDGDETSKPGRGVWDRYLLNGNTEDEQITLTLDDPPDLERGISLASFVKLSRPDGKNPPKDAEALKPPSGPALPSRFVAAMGDFDIKDAVEPQDGRLITPRESLTVEQAGTIEEVRVNGEVRAPAKGERLHALRVTIGPGPDSDAYDEDTYGSSDLVQADTEYAVKIGGDRRKVTMPENAQTATVIASVPTSVDDATLVATAAGRDQSVALSNGERNSTTAPALYLSRNEVGLTRQYPTDTYKKGYFDANYTVTFEKARLTPFDRELGWAPEGKAYLTLEMSEEELNWERSFYSLKLDRKKTTTVSDEHSARSSDAVKTGGEVFSGGYGRIVIPVDEESRTFKVKFQPTALYTAQHKVDPSSGTVTLKPLEFEVKFPAH